MKIYRGLNESGRISYFTKTEEDEYTRLRGDSLFDLVPSDEIASPRRMLAPLNPRTIIGIAFNYALHVKETDDTLPERPIFFIKLPAALQDPGQPIQIPTQAASTKVDYEGELAVIIGKAGKNIPEEKALDHVFGYSIANDVSARDWQKDWGGGQFCRGKSFDTFCPLGPNIVTSDEIPDPQSLQITTRVNGEIRQDLGTKHMIFPVKKLIAFLSTSTTLLPGTVILTGTPPGVAMGMESPTYLQAGDQVSISIPGIGTLENPVEKEILKP